MITSTANPHVKYIRSLIASRRRRDHERCFVVEGVRLVAEALAAHLPLHLALYAPDQLAATSEGQHLALQLGGQNNCYAAAAHVVAAATDTVTPQGVVAVVPFPSFSPLPGVWLVLDELQDPGNVGTLLRSAEAAGAGLVMCSRGTVDVASPKVVRSAMGAHFSLPIRADLTYGELAEALQGIPRIYAAVATAALPYYQADWHHPAVLIIGSEAHGVSPNLLALATSTLAIPMAGRLGSLNAAAAGSIILFEALRQHAMQPTS